MLAAAVLEYEAQEPTRELIGTCWDPGGRASSTGTRWIGFNAKTQPTVSRTSKASTLSPLAPPYRGSGVAGKDDCFGSVGDVVRSTGPGEFPAVAFDEPEQCRDLPCCT